jgi:ABC-type branched-subunit amino acid transport system substrate-binding protein
VKLPRALAPVLLGAVLLSACGKFERKLRLVTLTDLTGPQAVFGDGIRTAAALALADRRPALEAGGWRIELAAYDAHGSTEEPAAAAAARIAAQPDVFCAVVHTATEGIFLSLPALRAAEIPVVVPAETTPLSGSDSFPAAAWLSSDDRTHGAADADWAAAYGFQSVFLLVESMDHSQTIAESFRQRADSLSIKITRQTVSSRGYSSAWTLSFTATAPQLVYFSGSALTIPPLLRDLEETGFHGAFLFAEGEAEDQIPTLYQSDSIRLLFSPATADSEDFSQDESFLERYRAAYEMDPPPLSELGYDAAALCLQPLLGAAALDPSLSTPRKIILSAWQSKGMSVGSTGEFAPGGGRPCRTWIYSPPRGSAVDWVPLPGEDDPAGTAATC